MKRTAKHHWQDNEIAFDKDGQPVGSCGFAYPDEADGDGDGVQVELSAQQQLSNLLAWLDTPKATEYFGQTFKHRKIALAWVFSPEQFDGKSLSEIARAEGVSQQYLSRFAAEARRVFGHGNRSQLAHGKSFRKETTTPEL